MVEASMTSRVETPPMGDSESVREGFWVSLVVHGAGLLTVLLMVWWQGREREPEPLHVFELVSTAEAAEVAVPTEAPTPQPQAVQVPRLNVEPLRPIPTIPEPQPAPAPAPQPAPAPAPQPRPAPREVAQPPPPRQVTLEEFRRQHPQTPQRTAPAPARRTVPQAGIDTEAIRRNLRQLGDLRETSTPNVPRTAAQQSQIDAWAAEVRRRLDAAWDRPQDLGGRRLTVRVSFTVETDGRLTGVRVATPSGEPVLDASVLAAFRAASPVRPPPHQQRSTYTMNFELTPG